MAKRNPGRRGRPTRSSGRTKSNSHPARRPATRTRARGSARRAAKRPKRIGPARALRKKAAAKAPAPSRKRAARAASSSKKPRLDRVRRTLPETMLTPPSSLDMDRHGSAARTGREGLKDSLREHTGMTPALTGGDVDADWENAYFSGDEAPGGDNPTPDQEVVEEIGKSLGVEYQDAEELRGSDKVVERDKHRWELDPASSEDYKERK